MKKILFVLLSALSITGFAGTAGAEPKKSATTTCVNLIQPTLGTARIIDIKPIRDPNGTSVKLGLLDAGLNRRSDNARKSTVLCQAQRDGSYKLIQQ